MSAKREMALVQSTSLWVLQYRSGDTWHDLRIFDTRDQVEREIGAMHPVDRPKCRTVHRYVRDYLAHTPTPEQ